MIPIKKWNGVVRELANVNTDIFIKAILNNYHGSRLAIFSYFRLNFIANYGAMNSTTKSSKHDLACISLQLSVKL